MKIFIAALLLMVLCSCAPWSEIHKVSLGMEKSEVVQLIGNPVEASGSGNEEYLWYVPVNKFWNRYYVRLVDGRVESYGPVLNKSNKP